MESPAEVGTQLEEEARRIFAFAGITKPTPKDRFVLITGMTGAGKSSFVARCSGKEVKIWHSLFSCTDSLAILDYIDEEGRHVYLVDTPGFNDTNRSDAETLARLGTYLSASYRGGAYVDGVIYLQRITDVRMSGSSVRNVAMLQAMCDLPSYSRFAVVTTMWPRDHSIYDRSLLVSREDDLRTNRRYFGPLVSKDATLVRHAVDGAEDPIQGLLSARQIVSHLLGHGDTQTPMVLRIQRELVDENKTLEETLAGKAVRCDILKAQEEHDMELRNLRALFAAEKQKNDMVHADSSSLRELQEDLASKIAAADSQMQLLKSTLERIYEREQKAIESRVEEVERKFHQELMSKSHELAEMEESVRLLRQDVARKKTAQSTTKTKSNSNRTPPLNVRRRSNPKSAKRLEQEEKEQDALISDTREKLNEYKVFFEEFKDKRGNVRNGVANGVAAGVTSGAIAASPPLGTSSRPTNAFSSAWVMNTRPLEELTNASLFTVVASSMCVVS